jgi:hypothetical protein
MIMGFLGGVFKSLVNPATLLQLATGPAGWASLAMRTIGTAIAQQVIQQLGQKLGLPSSVINMAQQAFAAASGTGDLGQQTISQAVNGLAKQFNLSPVQAGQLEQSANASAEKITSKLSQSTIDEEGEVSAKGGKLSFLVALAKAMGKLMDAKAAQMQKVSTEISNAVDGSKAGEINGVDGSKNSSESTKLSSQTALLQAYGQELSILSNAFSQTAKSFGEANTTNARKG